jgi:hypothetical protein
VSVKVHGTPDVQNTLVLLKVALGMVRSTDKAACAGADIIPASQAKARRWFFIANLLRLAALNLLPLGIREVMEMLHRRRTQIIVQFAGA